LSGLIGDRRINGAVRCVYTNTRVKKYLKKETVRRLNGGVRKYIFSVGLIHRTYTYNITAEVIISGERHLHEKQRRARHVIAWRVPYYYTYYRRL